MSRIDDITKQIRQAQAQAIRNAAPGDVTNPSKIEADAKKILQDSMAKKQAAAQPQPSALVQDTRTTQQKYDDAQKAYDAYKETDEYRKNIAANKQEALQQAMDTMFAGGLDLPANLARPAIEEDTKAKELQAAADYYKQQLDTEKNQEIMDSDLAQLEGMTDEERTALELYATNRNRDMNAPIELTTSPFYKTAEQEASALISKYGKQKVDELAESFMRSETQKTTEAVTEKARDKAGSGFLGAVGQSAASVGANLVGSMTGALGYLQEAGQGTGRYSTMDPNNAGNLPNAYAAAVRQEVAENIAGDDGSTGRELLSYGYQGVMSAADSIARAALFGHGSLGLAALGSFSQTMSEASRQGASPTQAAIMATGSAALEVATEYIPLDEMLKAAKGGAKGAMRVAGEAMKQAGIEAATEEISLFGNLLLEAAVLQEKSSYKQQIGEAVAHGASYEEAKKQADKAVWNEAVQTALVSGFSGAASGGGSALVGNMTAQTGPVTQEQAAVESQTATQQQAAEMEPTAQQQEAQQAAQLPETPEQTMEFIMDDMGKKLAQTAPQKETAQKSELDNRIQQATDAVFGVGAEETQKNTAENGGDNDGLQPYTQHEKENRKSSTGSIATPESVQADSFTSETPGGTAPTNIIAEDGSGVKGVGAAEANFSGLAEYQNLLYEGNVQPDRPGDVRPMEVPKKDLYGRNVSETAANLYGAEITTDEMATQIEFLIQDGALGFDTRKNQDALNEAAAEIQEKGAAASRNKITRAVANGKIVDGDIEKAMLLYSAYAQRGDVDNASEMIVDLATMGNMAGRNLQLFKLLRKLTPEGQAMTVKKMVERSVENMIRSGQVKKGYKAEVDPQLLKEYQKTAAENARAVSAEQKEASAEKMQEIQQAIFAAEAAKMPATFKAKWDAWRYMAMLGNAKTQVRNFAGNLLFMPYKKAKDTMAAVFEKALPKNQRTKAVFQDVDLLAWAKVDAKNPDVVNALKYSGKIGEDASSAQFAENKKVFNNKALEAIRKASEWAPKAGDMLFKNGYYAESLAGFLKARGYTGADFQNGNIPEGVMLEARSYAVQEAMKATFNDCNAFSDAIASFGRKTTDNAWTKALNVVGEAVLPFRRTPANIIVRFTEYSPVGLLKGAWDMATKVQSGKISAAAAIDQISAGMTGSAVMALGYFLAKGIGGVKITGSGTDEDEKRQGHQDYALEFSIGGETYSYKIDWAAPANLPLFVGANICKALEDAGEDADVSFITTVMHSLATMMEPMLALSCMSSLNDLVEGIRYAPEGEALYTAATDIATSYLTQGIPALVRQTHQAIRENKTTTFANSDDATIRDLQKIGAQVTGSGAFQTDKRNAWGETETTESGWLRAVNAFFNPGTLKKVDNGPVETELSRLKEVQAEKVSPPVTGKTVTYTDNDGNIHRDMRLTEEQYQTLAKTQGQTAKRLLEEIFASKDYQSMTDVQKAATVQAVYDYAKEQGKKAALPGYYSTAAAWMGSLEGNEVNGLVKRGTEKVLNSIVDDAVQSISRGWEVTEATKKGMDNTYAAFENMSEEARQAIREDAEGDAARFLEVRGNGVSTEAFVQAVANIKSAKSAKNADKWEAIAKTTGMTPEEIDVVMKAYMADYDPEDESPDKTELKYDYAREEMDLTPAEYVEAYRVQLDGGKKAEKMQKWMDMGYTWQEADILYKLFAATGNTKIDVEKWYNEQ